MTFVAEAALRAVKAAYAPAATEKAWLQGICSALDEAGVGTWHGYAAAERCIRTGTGRFERDIELVRSVNASMPPFLFDAAHVPSPVVDSARARWARIARALGTTLEQIEGTVGPRIPELTGVFCFDARARGALLAVEGDVRFAPRTHNALTAVAAHVAAAFRLRDRLDRGPDAAGAVCSPSGALLHATPEAASRREPLASAVKRFGLAQRTVRRLDADEALAAWTAMVEGRWTLVDYTDTDGKRAILAHRNVPPTNVAALGGDEARVATLAALGHSNKYIAYELGFAISTTAALLRRALIKLGLRDRRELVRVLGPLARIEPSPS